MSVIQIRCRPWSVLPFGLRTRLLRLPRCSIDGGPERVCAWGDNVVPVWPGWHHLRVWHTWTKAPTAWYMQTHVADLRVHVADSQAVHVLYTTGFHYRMLGRMTAIGTFAGGNLPALGTPPAYAATAQPDAAPPPVGWYRDPAGHHQYRWWDGRLWTPTVSDAASTPGDPHPR